MLGRILVAKALDEARDDGLPLAHSTQYHIRVINLSVGALARLPYRADPLAAAVEIAWDR
ncbi:MAG: hypothetical protein E6I75_19245 [Chloroflexi bacterium]|nr:MAG: hypothetical protein E6I75_19245 [Chloroflexota bacterium]